MKTIGEEKKIKLLMIPLIFIIGLHIPEMIFEILPRSYMNEGFISIRNPFMIVLLVSNVIWIILFSFIPTPVYVVMLVVYTFVSWRWIMCQKKMSMLYCATWVVLCIVSIFLYWKYGEGYRSMILG